MKVEYYHDNPRNTFAVEVPDCTVLHGVLVEALKNPEQTLLLKVGMSQCSAKDNFSKREGRRIADSRMALVNFELMGFFRDMDKNLEYKDTLVVQFKHKDLRVDLLYRGISKRPFLIYASNS